MGTYLDRYLAGEYEEVWTELLVEGEKIRNEPLYSDALAVAQETMRRAKINIGLLIERLISIGYEFEYPIGLPNVKDTLNELAVFIPPLPNVNEQVAEIESTIGPMPLALQTWYEVVGTVNLEGKHRDWPIQYFAPLTILPIEMIIDDYDNYKDFDDDPNQEEQFETCVATNVYGDDLYALALPNPSIDALDTDNKQTFVSFLRFYFKCAGFEWYTAEGMNPEEVEIFKYLSTDLLPI
jgi:hypothetical protein